MATMLEVLGVADIRDLPNPINPGPGGTPTSPAFEDAVAETLVVDDNIYLGVVEDDPIYKGMFLRGRSDGSVNYDSQGFFSDPTGDDKQVYFINAFSGMQFYMEGPFIFPRFDTAARDAMPDQHFGGLIYNSQLQRYQQQFDPTPGAPRWGTTDMTYQNDMAYSAAMTPDLEEGSHWRGVITDGNAFAINGPFANHRDLTLAVTLQNNHIANTGAATWNPVYKMAAWGVIAAGFKRTIVFRCNGTNWVEIGRSLDIPN